MTCEARVQFAADAIMRYLQAHHESADTVEGIHEWWIEWPAESESIFITYTALIDLESRGIIERRQMSHREIWRLARPQAAKLGTA